MDKQYPLKYSVNHPYNRYSDYLKTVFGKPMQKVSIDAGFSCPNIDGTKSRGGCIYCNNSSFNPNYKFERENIAAQIEQGISKFTNRKPGTGFIAYFQSHTNTHAPVNELAAIFRRAIAHPAVEGLIIATRPDCLGESVLDLLSELNNELFVGIEIGIESTLNDTLKLLNRGHKWEDTLDAVDRVKRRGLHLGGHLILGLPGETREDIDQHALKISKLPLDTVKLHQLQIVKNTGLEKIYKQKTYQIRLFPVEEYIDICINFTEKMNPEVVIERFASESKPDLLAVKMWSGVKNHQIADWISNEMKRRSTWQSRLFEG
ncbi:coproporphyrinogen III oxidase [Salinivirga cyanobacteriivorans]|uniref:Coproporphyrinogen III oxidase n=1 Tax=Salinivirga cyanobacteriivorans TaxID=1307839 RepID=A0A0S2HZH1_9BACT|nr:TIGR01212 family radical SAM protein [Salinivirga cyanobacteriivorans]ALO15244.1 coproporphyrinogen III oxidase [Salinivirga cyanobacteriivorans]